MKILDVAIKGVNRSREAFRQTRADLRSLRQEMRGLTPVALSGGVKGLAAGVRGLGGALNQVTGFIGPKLGFLSFAALTEGARRATAATLDYGAELLHLKRKTGLGVEALQELHHAANLSDIPIEDFNVNMERFAVNLAKARGGSGDAGKAVRALGISLKDSSGKWKTTEQLLPEVADKLNEVQSAGRRGQVAMALFGRSGRSMLNVLSEGSAGMAAMREEARKLGGVITEEQAKGLDEAGDSWTRVKRALTGVRNVAVTALMPSLTELTNRITTFFKTGDNAQIVARGVTNTMRFLGAAAITGARGVAWLTEHVGGLRGVAIIASTVLSVRFLGALAETLPLFKVVGTALKDLAVGFLRLGIAVLANPVLFWATALAALALVVWVKWKPIRNFFLDLFDDLKIGFQRVVSGFEIGWLTIAGRFDEAKVKAAQANAALAKSVAGAEKRKAERTRELDRERAEKERPEAPSLDFSSFAGIGGVFGGDGRPALAGVPAGTSGARPVVEPLPVQRVAARVDGLIRLQIDSPAPVRVQELRSGTRDVKIEVDTGLMTAGR